MQIKLDGNVDLEVENIPEGEERVCRQLIEGLQEGLAGEVQFDMKDWGRAENAEDRAVDIPTQQREQAKRIEIEGDRS